MPATSGKQYRFMELMAHGKHHNIAGPSKKVAEEFIHATSSDKRKKWAHKKKSNKM